MGLYNRSMKILLMAPQPFYEERGTPINVRLVAELLGERGHEIDLLTYAHGENVDIPGVRIRRVLKLPFLRKPPIGPSLPKIIYDALMLVYALFMRLGKKYDVIHAVEESVFIALFLQFWFRTPFVFDMDSHMTDQLRYSKFMKSGFLLRIIEWLENRSLEKSSVVITVCKYLTDVAGSITSPSKIFQIEDIPLAPAEPPTGVSVETLKEELGIDDSAPLLVYTGNLEKYQGIDLLLDSAELVMQKGADAKFIIVGGSDEDVKKYKAKAKELGLGDFVIFTGRRPINTMGLFYEMADILLSPRIEGTNTPLKVYSYLDTGKPVVATDLPTHTQVMNDEVATLAKPEKVAFSEAILLLLGDKKKRVELGLRGQKFVRENYNREIFAEKLKQAYAHLVEKNR